MRNLLAVAFLLGASHAAAQVNSYGCRRIQSVDLDAATFEREFRSTLPAPAGTMPNLETKGHPGVSWDLGEKQTARLSLYFIKDCSLGIATSLRHGYSSPHISEALKRFAETIREEAPGWALTVESPNTIVLQKGAVRYSTDLPMLLQARIDAATPMALNGTPVRILFDGGSLFLSQNDLEKSLLLERPTWIYPARAYYDLKPYGLPAIIVQIEKAVVTVWALP